MTIQKYLETLNLRYKTGISREHTYRGDLQSLLMAILPDVLVTNEPARVACGAPDYMLTRKDVPIGYIEAKDIGVDLQSKTLKEQFDRYRFGLPNLIFTDYLDFHFYKDSVFTIKVSIAKIENGNIVSRPENFSTFEALVKNFAETISQTIKSPTKLAEMMAGKAKLMADVIERSLNHDDETETKSNLKQQMLSFKQMLIHDTNNSAFADIYAQTIAYGMFAARYHDPTLPTFSRQEAATLIPKSNPFLRKLFQEIAGYDLDDRLVWMVDELVNIFLATDVADIMRNFGKSTKQEDPVVHFYETFLAAYDPALRKAKGVWYTPQPVVSFIVRAVDDILKSEFNLPQGLADTSKIKIKRNALKFDERSKDKSIIIGKKVVEEEIHKVQILDPATGTGTFLAEVVKYIYKKFEGQQGIWSKYVDQHLIPRLNGFELLMASYAMAHLKLDMLLTETGYKATNDQRFKIFLTNSLEPTGESRIDLFNWLSDEANQANAIKNDTPLMIVMGNPPYSISSTNKSVWIENLVDTYKKGVAGANKNSLSDDYVKFIRYGQHLVEKNGEGILAYISNNSFLNGITHHKMRESLLLTFDKVYIIDLHGSYKKNEKNPEGGNDENVFDIQQGVSINIFVKRKNLDREVKIFDLFGLREFKYNFLIEKSLDSINWKTIVPELPNLFLKDFDYKGNSNYEFGFSIKELFITSGTGIKFRKDNLLVKTHFRAESVSNLIDDMHKMNNEEILKKYNVSNTPDWNINDKKKLFQHLDNAIQKVQYRPFDNRYTYYPLELINQIIVRGDSRKELMKHLLHKDNFGLITTRLNRGISAGYIFISANILDLHLLDSAADSLQTFPLYIYPNQTNQISLDDKKQRAPNLKIEIVNQISQSVSIPYDSTKETESNLAFGPIDLLDYIYAVLHSPSYREKYKEFLKIDFPRILYPTAAKQFWQLVVQGKKLRELHLLESEETDKYITQYPIDGSNEVIKPIFFFLEGEESLKLGRVYINENQFFDFVPEIAWNFYIGGYQPAQKWLKDRKGRILDFDDILHYQKIIVALTRTSQVMREIDQIMLTK